MSDGKWDIQITHVDPQAVTAQMNQALVQGLNTWLQIVAEKARDKAPIRKIWKTGGKKTRKTAWRTVGALGGTKYSTSLTMPFQTKSGDLIHLGSPNMRLRTTKGGGTVVQVKSWRKAKPSQEERSTWEPGTGFNAMGSDYSGMKYESRMTSRARWALKQAMRDYVEDERHLARTTDRYGEPVESALINVLATPHGSKHREANFEEGLAAAGRAKPGETFRLQFGGFLRKSIKVMPAHLAEGRISGGVEATASYAKFVEFGTATRGRAQPFLRPALHENRRQLARSVGSDVRHVFRK